MKDATLFDDKRGSGYIAPVEGEAVPIESEVPAIIPETMPDDRLLEKVLGSGNIEILERYIALRKSEEERQAKLEYSRHFSEMQSDFIGLATKRTKQAYKYKYAPIEELQKTYNPVIFKHGFSYSWSDTPLENGEKRVTMTVSGWGHSVNNSFDVPVPLDDGQKNAIHDRGKQSTYGRRYTFISGFGLVIEDEDDDANNAGLNEAIVKVLESIEATDSIAKLQEVFTEAWGKYKGDISAQKLISAAKDQKKKELK